MKRSTVRPSIKPPKAGHREAGAAATSGVSPQCISPNRTLAEQKIDFTAEGAPPPQGQVASAAHGKVSPLMPNDFPSQPHVASPAAGTVERKSMKQAFHDVTRGLQDTDRGTEAGRTYRKLKTVVRPLVRRKSGK